MHKRIKQIVITISAVWVAAVVGLLSGAGVLLAQGARTGAMPTGVIFIGGALLLLALSAGVGIFGLWRRLRR